MPRKPATILDRDYPRPEPESAFQATVEIACREFGWRFYHPRPLRRADGSWETALTGHPGFPDLLIARAGSVIAWELKAERASAKPTADQLLWLEALAGGRVIDSGVRRPSDWPAMLHLLSDGRATAQ